MTPLGLDLPFAAVSASQEHECGNIGEEIMERAEHIFGVSRVRRSDLARLQEHAQSKVYLKDRSTLHHGCFLDAIRTEEIFGPIKKYIDIKTKRRLPLA